MTELAGLTWPEASELPDALLVPLGSTEQHGPHLPVSTDSIIAEAWAKGIAAASEGTAVVAPVLPFGASGEHQEFPGTLSLGTEVLHLVLVELARSAAARFDRIVFVSGHGGNADALVLASGLLRSQGHTVDVLLPVVAGSDAHAGHTETSLMLHLAPELVALDRAVAGPAQPVGELMAAMLEGGVIAVSSSGVLGDPSRATAQAGREILSGLVRSAVAKLNLGST